MKSLVFFLLFAFSFAASSRTCDLYYSFNSHPNAWKVLGKAIVKAKETITLDAWRPFMKKEDNRLHAILTNLHSFDDKLKISRGDIMQGGYKGETQLSLRRQLKLLASATDKDVLALASVIGYIYLQDSVLLVCERGKQSSRDNVAYEYELVDTGKQAYLNAETASMLYGMVIGRLNNLDSMGYSFDLKNKTYMVLEFDESKEIKTTLQDISEDLNQLSQGNVKLAMTTAEVDVYFPHNDWREQLEGQHYLANLNKLTTSTQLKKEQIKFIRNLSGFIAELQP